MKRKTGAAWLYLRVAVALILLGGAIAGYCALQPGGLSGKVAVTLAKVSDGDTIRVKRGGEELKVRLVGIDTPELGTADSFRSALFTAELLEGAREIYLEQDTVRPTDKYGRILGWIWVVTPDGNELLLQEELLKAGLAELYEKGQPGKYHERLKRAK